MIKPSIGRKVWFFPATGDQSTRHDDQPMDATVVYVHNDRMVNLGVRDHNGNSSGRLSVPLLDEGEAPPEHGYYAAWMPYQRGQAAKTEALESRLSSQNSAPPPPPIENIAEGAEPNHGAFNDQPAMAEEISPAA